MAPIDAEMLLRADSKCNTRSEIFVLSPDYRKNEITPTAKNRLCWNCSIDESHLAQMQVRTLEVVAYS